ncbi:MAG: hypothetical protein HYR56_02750 [Acidobacteria bacterium]|nr:hypothetical protein [Acidobacteriota bacterium]MBI3421614.1 hypothetical protein [Acidobacteriota bacterium]
MLAIGLVCLIVVGFLAVWLFANNMKVGRALLVTFLGDGYKFTKDLLNADNHLPYYRIFAWDMSRLAFFVSAAVVPLSLFGIRAAWRALRLAKEKPVEYGGLRTAQLSLGLACVLFVAFSAAGLNGIPDTIERERIRHAAATRALMYEHAQALQHYYYEYGTFPREGTDLVRLGTNTAPQADYWEQQFKYAPFGTIASARGVSAFSSYTLTSAGPDGEFGTSDDILMIDGVVVDKPAEAELPASLLIPEKKPRR